MKQVAANALTIDGEEQCRAASMRAVNSSLSKHFNANGSYVLTDVEHVASMEGTYSSNESVPLRYKNTFRCIPAAIPFRPQRSHPEADDQRHANGHRRRAGRRRDFDR